MNRSRALGLAAVVGAATALSGVSSASAETTPNVGFLDSVSGHGPEPTPVSVTLDAKQNGANLLVAMVAADGPDTSADQVATVTDDRHHTWTPRLRHVVSGAVIEVFTSPGTGHDAGTVVTSSLGTHAGDEGQAVTVAAWANATFAGTIEENGSGGIPHVEFNIPAHSDTYTVFVDDGQSEPITLIPGFHAVNVGPLGDATSVDHDLFQVSHLNSHDTDGAVVSTGNTGPAASPYWGIVDVNVVPFF